MVGQARQPLQQIPPVTFTLGQVLYHPEAITLVSGQGTPWMP